MKDIVSCIEQLRLKLDRYRKENLNESSTRRIFIDPLLQALGWDVTDTGQVQLEYPTIDRQFVDYALKLAGHPILFIEAKPLNDPLTNVQDITQVVKYAATDGIEWCILTNGVTYKVYSTMERAIAPDKLLFEVSIDQEDSEGKSAQQIAEQLTRLSPEGIAKGALKDMGQELFAMKKVAKALEKLFSEAPLPLIRLIRSNIDDDLIKPADIKRALRKSRPQIAQGIVPSRPPVGISTPREPSAAKMYGDYGQGHHTEGKPGEVVELYEAIDEWCRELNPGNIQKKHLAKYISYSYKKAIFCCVHIQKSGLRVWLKLDYSRLENPPDYVRDVSKVGHWGVGNVEADIRNIEQLQIAKPLIKQSYEASK